MAWNKTFLSHSKILVLAFHFMLIFNIDVMPFPEGFIAR